MRNALAGLIIAALASSAFGASATLIDVAVDFDVAPPSPYGGVLSASVTTTATYRVPTLSTAAPFGSTGTLTMGGTALAAGSNYMPDPPNAPPQYYQTTSFNSSAQVSGSYAGIINEIGRNSVGDNYAGNGSIVRGSRSYSFDLSLLNPNANGYVDFSVLTYAGFAAGTRIMAGQSIAALAMVGVGTFDIDLPGQILAVSYDLAAVNAADTLPTLPSGLTYIEDDDGSPLVMYKGFDGPVTDALAPDLLTGLPSVLLPEPTTATVGAAATLVLLARRRRA